MTHPYILRAGGGRVAYNAPAARRLI